LPDTVHDGDRCVAASIVAAAALRGTPALRGVLAALTRNIRVRLEHARDAVRTLRTARSREEKTRARSLLVEELHRSCARQPVSWRGTLNDLGWHKVGSGRDLGPDVLGVADLGTGPAISLGCDPAANLILNDGQLELSDVRPDSFWTYLSPPPGVRLKSTVLKDLSEEPDREGGGRRSGGIQRTPAPFGMGRLMATLYRLSNQEMELYKKMLADLAVLGARLSSLQQQLDQPDAAVLQKLADVAMDVVRSEETYGLSLQSKHALIEIFGFRINDGLNDSFEQQDFAAVGERMTPGSFLALDTGGHAILAARTSDNRFLVYDSQGISTGGGLSCLAVASQDEWRDLDGPLKQYHFRSVSGFSFSS
jgi:hypothetical protein